MLVNRFVQKYEKDIQHLLQFDSQLLYIIPYICPEEDTSALCDILPLDLAIVWLIERLNLSSEIHNLRLSTISLYKVKFMMGKLCIVYDHNYIDGKLFQEANSLHYSKIP